MSDLPTGLGDPKAPLRVHIANIPDYPPFNQPAGVMPLSSGDIASIGQACGNGWRKVFNVFAKFVYAGNYLNASVEYSSWQSFRDNALLQAGSGTCLLFSPPDVSAQASIQLVMGKHYAMSLDQCSSVEWIDHQFAVDPLKPLIVCPYFDYRQLSNAAIIQLVEILNQRKHAQDILR